MNKSINKKFKIIILFIIMTLSSGCWDYKEVEERGYVLGIGIDKAYPIPHGYEEGEGLNEEKLEKTELQTGKPKYAFTIQIPVLPKAQINPIGTGGGGESESRTWDLTILGNSLFEANREFSTRLDYAPFYEHLQAVVISEEVAREGIVPPLDMMLRDPEMRRRTRLFITPESAMQILDVEPRIDDYSAIYLSKLPRNANKTSRMAHVTDLGQVAESLHGEVDFALPRVISIRDEVKYAGVAVFKKDKMVGWLGEIDTIYAKWVRDIVKGGIIVIKAPDNPNVVLTLELRGVDTQVKPIVDKENNIKMKISSKAVVNIAEESRTQYKSVLNENFMKKVENAAQEEVEKRIRSTIEHVQKELGADIFHFNVTLKREKPKVWEEVKDDWYEIFEKLDVDVDVKIRLEYVGTIK